MFVLKGEERRRGMRREDPRRHTLGGDMLAFTNQQNIQQQSQKALDLEVCIHNHTYMYFLHIYIKLSINCLQPT